MKRRKLIQILAGLAALLTLGLPQAMAVNTGPQALTGAVSGKVFKPYYTSCPEANVELVMSKENIIKTKTDAGGKYVITGVPAGTNYTVTASKAPFKPATKSAVNVIAQKTTTVNLVLKP